MIYFIFMILFDDLIQLIVIYCWSMIMECSKGEKFPRISKIKEKKYFWMNNQIAKL